MKIPSDVILHGLIHFFFSLAKKTVLEYQKISHI